MTDDARGFNGVMMADVIRPSTAREDLGMVLAGCWLLAGAGLDGRAHVTSELDSFFTVWHAVLYAGFAACAAWVGVVTARRGAISPSNAPAGYRAAWAGLGLFALGGIGDLIWHSSFGVERDLAATFSPPHLALLFGALLILTSPLRAVWPRAATRAPWPAVASAGLAMTVTALALTWLSPFVFLDAYEASFVQGTSSMVRAGLAAILLSNVVFIAPVLLLRARWRLPVGSLAALWVVPVTALVLTNEPSNYPLIMGTAGAALVAEVGVVATRDRSPRWFAALAPLLLWGAYVATLQVWHGIGWEPELWGGALVWTSATGLALGELVRR